MDPATTTAAQLMTEHPWKTAIIFLTIIFIARELIGWALHTGEIASELKGIRRELEKQNEGRT